MNWKKHEGSLLKVFSDAGSTPAASTIYKILKDADENSGKMRTDQIGRILLPTGLMTRRKTIPHIADAHAQSSWTARCPHVAGASAALPQLPNRPLCRRMRTIRNTIRSHEEQLVPDGS